jgi:hypothetical protein
MFHFLVNYSGWADDHDSVHLGRCFEYTSDPLKELLNPGGVPDTQRIKEAPALLTSEIGSDAPQMARVVRFTEVQLRGRELHFDYVVDNAIPPLHNDRLKSIERELGIDSFEFSRSHWAVKHADLYRALFKHHIANSPSPKVFRLDTVDGVDNDLVSLMMPFHPSFDDVHASIVSASSQCGMQCLRADDIWEHEAIIQDIVSLINRSRIVVCDCTSRNPNVFYEAGIAHSIGKDVILISQNAEDVPFDLKHLRFVAYVDNAAGRERLAADVAARIRTLKQRAG